MTVMPKTYVLGCENWLFPANVSLTATPKPLIAMTDTEPTSEHIEMYTAGFVRPYFGTTRYIITRLKTRTVKQYIMKPVIVVSTNAVACNIHDRYDWATAKCENYSMVSHLTGPRRYDVGW